MKRALIPLMAMFLLAAPVAAQERGIGDIYEDGYAALQVLVGSGGQDGREEMQAIAQEGIALIDAADIPECGVDVLTTLRTALFMLDRGVDLSIEFEDAVKRGDNVAQDALETEMMYVISSGVYLMEEIPMLTAEVSC